MGKPISQSIAEIKKCALVRLAKSLFAKNGNGTFKRNNRGTAYGSKSGLPITQKHLLFENG